MHNKTLSLAKRHLASILIWILLACLACYQLGFNTTIQSDMSAFMSVRNIDTDNNNYPASQNKILNNITNRIWLLGLKSSNTAELANTSRRLAQILRNSGHFTRVNNGEATAHPKFTPNSSTPNIIDGVWFSRNHHSALLVLETRAEGLDLDAQEKIHRLINKAFSQANTELNIQLEISGVPMLALSSRQQIKTESQQLSIAAGLFMLIFLGWVYVSPRRVLLSALPLIGGILFAAAIVSFFYASLHSITLAFGITLLGVAVDYPVHIFSHQRPQESSITTVRRIWPTLRLGVLTSVLGYSAMALTDLTGLAQLGMFSIAGLISAALITRSLLPILLNRQQICQPHLMSFAQKLDMKPGKIRYFLAVPAVIFMITSLWRTEGIWSEDIADLSPVSNELRLQYSRLREQACNYKENLNVIDSKTYNNHLLNNFRNEALNRIAWASGLIVLILGLSLANRQRLLRVILPVLLAVGIAAAVPLALGEKLNLFHLVSLLLVAGIGLDYGLFFSRPSTDDNIQTLHALLVCAISTGGVFAMLAFSDISVLHSIGITVSVGVAAAFIYAWLFSRININET